MPTVEEITQQIADLRKKTVPLGEYQTGPEFGEVLRERLTRPEEIENIIKRIAEQRSRLLTIPAETRAEAPIGAFSPTQVAGLVAAREEPVRATWETLRGVKAEREGRLEEIIERATRGYEAQIEKQESKYEQERQKLEDLMAERDWIAGQSYKAKQLELEERRVAVAEREPTPTIEPTGWANAETYIQSNITAENIGSEAMATIYATIKKSTDLTDSDIKALMAQYGMIPDAIGGWSYRPVWTPLATSGLGPATGVTAPLTPAQQGIAQKKKEYGTTGPLWPWTKAFWQEANRELKETFGIEL